MKTTNKLDSLTFLRFIAASCVVMFHYGTQTTLYQLLPILLQIGPLMVTFFFVLSGFVIAISNIGKPLQIDKFYATRVARIFPAYLLALILYTAVVGSRFLSADFLLPLSMLQAWFPGNALRGNAPGWSVSVEIFFYAVAPALIILAGKQNGASWKKWLLCTTTIWLASLACVTVIAQKPFYSGYPSPSHDLVYYFPLSHFSSFLLGFAGGIAYKNGVLKDKFSNTSLIVALVAAMVATNSLWYTVVFISNHSQVRTPYETGFFALPFLVIIYICTIANKPLSKIFSSPTLVLLGEASYAIYIFQMPVALAVNRFIPESVSYSPDMKFALYFTILTAISIASYKLIETPITKAIRNGYARPQLPSMSTEKVLN